MTAPEASGPVVALFGAALRDPAVIDLAHSLGLRESDFAGPLERRVWAWCVEDRARGVGPDSALLSERWLSMPRQDRDESAVDFFVVLEGWQRRPGSRRGVPGYVEAIQDARLTRSMQELAARLSWAADGGASGAELADLAQSETLAALAARGGATQLHDLGPLVADALADLEAEARGQYDEAPSLRSGVRALDELWTTLRPGSYHLLAGRPSMGKTTLALQLLAAYADAGAPGLFVSRESTNASIARRAAAFDLRTAQTGIAERWGARGIRIVDRSDGVDTMDDAASAIRIAVQRHGVRVVALDYFQKFGFGRPIAVGGEVKGYSRNSGLICDLAKELGLVVIMLAQLNRGVEQRGDKRPMMSDLKECGRLEEDADSVVMLYRDGYYTGDAEDTDAEAIVRKQRDGATGTAALSYVPGSWFGGRG